MFPVPHFTRKRLLLGGFGVGLLLGLVVASLWLQPAEPYYQGQPLSAWVETLQSGQSPEREQARAAVLALGSNAVPALVRILQSRDSSAKIWLMRWTGKQSLIKFNWKPDSERHLSALGALRVLGPEGRAAIPALTEYMKNVNRSQWAVYALSAMGPEAIEPLTQALINPNALTRNDAAAALGAMGTTAGPAVPALTLALKDTSRTVRLNAAWALASIGRDPESVVPALIATLNDPDPEVRASVAIALKQFGPTARPAVPALQRALDDPEEQVRQAAATALQDLER